jgi:uncharacterized membrane protein YsdA (DUF1294 family)/cold shock CspA family protein
MKLKGKIISWNANKAFGFITPNGGGDDIFIHKSALSNKDRQPQIHDEIMFSVVKDKQGRYCAQTANFSGERIKTKKAKRSHNFSIVLSLLFSALLTCGYFINYFPKNLLFYYVGLSIISFIVYALDKSKAQRDAWRISESTLHFLALFGGWPGAAIAQQTLRHKSKKKRFRVIFWFTVITNSAALYWLTTPQGEFILKLFK